MRKKYSFRWDSWGEIISFFVWVFCVLLGGGLWVYWGFPLLKGIIIIFLFFTAGWFGYLSGWPKFRSKEEWY